MIDPDTHNLNLKKISTKSSTIPAKWIVVIALGVAFLLFYKISNDIVKKTLSDITISDIQNNGSAIVNFWASWCGACRAEHASLIKLSKEHHIKIFGIAGDNTPEAAGHFLASHGNPYFKVGMKTDSLANSFNLQGYPTNFIINKDGKITKKLGLISENNLEEVLRELQK